MLFFSKGFGFDLLKANAYSFFFLQLYFIEYAKSGTDTPPETVRKIVYFIDTSAASVENSFVSCSAENHGVLFYGIHESLDVFNLRIKRDLTAAWHHKAAIPILHPDIEALKQYDRAHNTFLCETLRVFLKNKCSYEKTKNDLFIHRSTLLYRIERIREMTAFDPDNYEDCLLMEICFLLET